MSFNWNDYHGLAESIYGAKDLGHDEARFRTVVSRAYYAAFWTARKFACEVDGQDFSRASVHQAVKNYFKAHTDPKRKSIGNRLDKARDARVNADYEESECTSRKAEITLKVTKQVLDSIHNLTPLLGGDSDTK